MQEGIKIQRYQAKSPMPLPTAETYTVIVVTEGSYTSQASFLDLDKMPVYDPDDKEEHVFSGKRIGRRKRLYRTKDGRVINADVQGSYNIIRKAAPNALGTEGVEDGKARFSHALVLHPVRKVVVPLTKSKREILAH